MQQRILLLQDNIAAAEIKYGRMPHAVQLLAVSKGRSVELIRAAFAAGLQDFAENYWQEAEAKIAQLQDLPITWHYIGPLQSNKCKHIARQCTWVHSVSRPIVAQKLAAARTATLTPLQVCIQVNFGDDPQKSGVSPAEIYHLIEHIQALPALKLRGLMLIPPQHHDQEIQYRLFMRLQQLMQTLNQRMGLQLDTLSMGMSEDYVAAIRAGSTMVRIGRSLFEKRFVTEMK